MRPEPSSKRGTIYDSLRKHVSTDAKIVWTRHLSSYDALAKNYNRNKVNHSAAQYARGDVHTNSMGSFWNILKRGIIRSYHKLSVEYLPNHLREFTYRLAHTRNGNGVGLRESVLRNALEFEKEQA